VKTEYVQNRSLACRCTPEEAEMVTEIAKNKNVSVSKMLHALIFSAALELYKSPLIEKKDILNG